MNPRLSAKVATLLGSKVRSISGASGGGLNETLQVKLEDGRRVFVKTREHPVSGMYLEEARGLAWLAQGLPQDAPVRVVQVLAASDQDDLGPACLLLECIEAGRKTSRFDEHLGRGLAALHRSSAPHFGFSHDNYIAVLGQANAACADWPSFYAERRLVPQLALACDKGRVGTHLRERIELLCTRLPKLAGPSEAPARLHGDLWSGNLLVDRDGRPCLIDPAVYAGHREMDLAMMRLFGGFSERVFAAYNEVFPLAPGVQERVALYQLYPLLVHVNLFGGHYTVALRTAVETLL